MSLTSLINQDVNYSNRLNQTHPLIRRFASADTGKPELSVVIPLYNEEENIDLLYERLVKSLVLLGYSWEVIFVDDGSTDNSFQKLSRIASIDDKVKIIKLVRNFGQTAGLAAGIDHALGDVIIPMDADLQNDPADIGMLLAKLDEGYDVVSGWRKQRQDGLFLRLVPSFVANVLISTISGLKLHDYGCSLKAYRKEVIKDIRLYGEMHRFVPIYANWMGGKVAEIPVTHHARKHGKSKYGISRTLRVVLDLITVKFFSSYLTSPIYLFGTAGIGSLVLSLLSFAYMLILKYGYGTTFIETPLPVLVTMFFVVGVQLLLMGLLAELVMRTYHESQGKRIYKVKTAINLDGNLLDDTRAGARAVELPEKRS